jgi:hypothetical protein
LIIQSDGKPVKHATWNRNNGGCGGGHDASVAKHRAIVLNIFKVAQ